MRREDRDDEGKWKIKKEPKTASELSRADGSSAGGGLVARSEAAKGWLVMGLEEAVTVAVAEASSGHGMWQSWRRSRCGSNLAVAHEGGDNGRRQRQWLL